MQAYLDRRFCQSCIPYQQGDATGNTSKRTKTQSPVTKSFIPQVVQASLARSAWQHSGLSLDSKDLASSCLTCTHAVPGYVRSLSRLFAKATLQPWTTWTEVQRATSCLTTKTCCASATLERPRTYLTSPVHRESSSAEFHRTFHSDQIQASFHSCTETADTGADYAP